tara:strand:+ start:1748 stop:2053 length:306 start_codon:yes stop_codon:yes gene_type:complete
MESPLTQKDFNLTYEYMFGKVNKYDADKMFTHMKDFETMIAHWPLDSLYGIQEYLVSCPILRKRQDIAEKQLIEYTPQQMELFTLEAEGLVDWYIKGKEEL